MGSDQNRTDASSVEGRVFIELLEPRRLLSGSVYFAQPIAHLPAAVHGPVAHEFAPELTRQSYDPPQGSPGLVLGADEAPSLSIFSAFAARVIRTDALQSHFEVPRTDSGSSPWFDAATSQDAASSAAIGWAHQASYQPIFRDDGAHWAPQMTPVTDGDSGPPVEGAWQSVSGSTDPQVQALLAVVGEAPSWTHAPAGGTSEMYSHESAGGMSHELMRATAPQFAVARPNDDVIAVIDLPGVVVVVRLPVDPSISPAGPTSTSPKSAPSQSITAEPAQAAPPPRLPETGQVTTPLAVTPQANVGQSGATGSLWAAARATATPPAFKVVTASSSSVSSSGVHSAAPGLPVAALVGFAPSGRGAGLIADAVQIANGSLAGKGAETVSDALATLTAPESLAAHVAYSFVHLSPEGVFPEALAAFVNEWASLPTAEFQSSAIGAWAVTAAVLAVDAVLLGTWYRGRLSRKRQVRPDAFASAQSHIETFSERLL